MILDGNFVHALRETRSEHFHYPSTCTFASTAGKSFGHDAQHVRCYRMGEPAELLAKLLGAPVKCYVTRCSLLELKGLGAPFSGDAIALTYRVLFAHHQLKRTASAICLCKDTAPGQVSPVVTDCCCADTLGAARKAGLHLSCGHDDKALSTAECILDNIGTKLDNLLPSHCCYLNTTKAGPSMRAISLRGAHCFGTPRRKDESRALHSGDPGESAEADPRRAARGSLNLHQCEWGAHGAAL